MRLAWNVKIEIQLIPKTVQTELTRRIKPATNQDVDPVVPNATLRLETSTSTGRASNAERVRSHECRSRFSTMRLAPIIEQLCLLLPNRQASEIYQWFIRSRRMAGD